MIGDGVFDPDNALLDKTDFLPVPPRVLNLQHGVLDLDTGVLRIFVPGKGMIVETLEVGNVDYVPGVDHIDKEFASRPPWSLISEAKARIAKWLQ